MALSAWERAARKEQEEKDKRKQQTPAPVTNTSTKKSTSAWKKEAEKEQGSTGSNRRTAEIISAPSSFQTYRPGNNTQSAPSAGSSYIERARKATEANIATGNTLSQEEKDRRREELENQLSELESQKSTLTKYIAGARRGNASKLVSKYSEQISDVENQIREVEKQLREVELPEYISYADQLKMQEEEQKEARNAARNATAQYSGSAGGRALASLMQRDPEAAREMFELAAETQGALDETQREQAWIDYLNKYSDHVHEDNFGGQFGANFRMGKFGEDTNKAFNRYLTTTSDVDRDYAMALQELEQEYARRNAAVLDDEGAVLPWVTQTAAGYLPQFWNNTKATVGGGAAGALAGVAIGNPVLGAKVGAVVGSGVESYGKMRGAAYRNLIAAGMDEQTALAAANDEAFISALVEMGDTALDVVTLGGAKALTTIANAALKSGSKNAAVKAVAGMFGQKTTEKLAQTAAKEAAKSTGRKVLETGIGLGVNVLGEGVQEGLQESVSIANQNRDESGIGDLIANTTQTLGQALSGENKEARAQILEAAGEGMKIALMFGGAQTATNTIINRLATAETRAQQEAFVESIRNDEENLSALIQEGKDSGEDSVSAKIATQVEQKVQNGEEVTAQDIKSLIAANSVYIAEEERQAQTARSVSNQEKTGYGEYGSRAFTEIVEGSGKSPDEVKVEFQTAYEAGMTNLPKKMASLVSPIEAAAFDAGRRDAAMSAKKAEAKGVTIWNKESGLIENEHSAKLNVQTRSSLQSIGKATGTKIIVEEIPAELNANGYYRDSDGTIHIDVNTEQPVMTVVKHELTHRMQSLAPKEYEQFRNYAVKVESAGLSYGSLTPVEKMQQDYLQRSGGKVQLSTEEAMDEIAAKFAEKILTDEKSLHDFVTEAAKSEDTRTMAQKFFDAVREFIQKVKAAFKSDKAKMDAEAKKQFGATIEQLERAEQLWKETYTAATKAAQDAKKAPQTKREGVLTRTVDADGTNVLTTANGNPVAQMDDNGSAVFSLKTYNDFGRAELKRWLDLRVSKNQIDKSDAEDMVKQLDEYYDLCQKFKDKYAPFGAWSDASVVRDNKGKPVFSVVKANGEYAMNLDFSLVCKKRRTLDAVFKEMISRNLMDNVSLEEADIARVNDIIRESGFETACALCFVDSKRYRQAKVADTFVSQYNDTVLLLQPEDGSFRAHHFDFVGTGNYKRSGNGIHTATNAELKEGIEKLKQVMRENGSKTVAHKIAKHLLENPQDRRLVSRSEFMNTDGFEAVKIKNPAVLKLYNSSKGAGGPKAAFSDVQYLGEILKKNNFTAARAYAVGGVRIQSFSDYIPRLVFDYLQMIADLSAKQLPAHAYTKEAIFVKQFGMTGIKMNMSLVPAIAKDGVAPGLDKDGNYYWFDGQSFGSDVNVKGSGNAGFELAKQIQNAPGYSANCGTIAVGVSDQHIWKMLDDPDIRMIIPYHKSSLNHIVAMLNNIDKYVDYTGVQNTRNADGTKISGKDFNFNEALRRTGDAKAAAKEYLAWCERNNYIPKFDSAQSKFSEHENYYKMLEDFSTYDNGEPAPQGAVTMTFPKEGDAFGSMAELIEEGLDEDAVLEARREKSVPEIVDKIEKVLPKREDVQFSLKGQNDLMKENAKLREVNEALREQFKLTTFAKVDAKKLESFTRQLLRDYNSGADRSEVTKALDELYGYIANGEGDNAPVWDTAYRKAFDIATSILEDASVVDDSDYREYKELRDTIRKTGITLGEDHSGSFGGYESLNDFRKANFGRILIKNDGIDVSKFYQELEGQYPWLFDSDTYSRPTDQLIHITEVLDGIQPYEYNPYSRDMRQSATWMANDIMDRFFEMPQAKPTFADKAERKLTQQKIADGKKLERVREQKNERIAKLIAQQREKVNRVQTEEREKRAEAVKKVKEQQRAKEARMSESRKSSVYKERIKKRLARISKMLLNPTESSHVPESMRKPIAGFLEAIDLSPKTTNKDGSARNISLNTINRLYRLQEAYQSILDKKTDADMEIDPDLIENISSVISALGEDGSITVSELSRSDLETLYRVVMAVERSIYSYNRTMNEAMQRTISDLGQAAMIENSASKGYQESSVRPKQWAADVLNMDMLNPQDFFMQIGETMDLLFQEIRRGMDTKIRNVAVAQEYMKELTKDVDLDKITGRKAKVQEFKTGNGQTISLTPAQVMSLYLLQRQKDAQDHIYVGGIKQAPTVALKGKGKRPQITRSYDVVHVTPEDVGKIIDSMTDEQKAVAEGISKFFTDYTAEWGNEVSLKLYGYKKFTVENYFPIVSDRNYIDDVFGETTDVTLKNMGSTKARQKGANNPVIIEDVFDVFTRQADQMSSYNAFVIPLGDMQRVFNFKTMDGSVKQAIEKRFGVRATRYFKQLMTDINGGARYNGGSEIANKLISNYKQAKMGLNLRVILQQPSAYMRAASVMDAKYLAQAVGKKSSANMETIYKYAPIAQWKKWGFFSMDTGKRMKELIMDERTVSDVTMWAAGKMDELTWKRLWVASEMEIRDKHPDLQVGSEDYYKAVGKRFGEVVDRTQVVDSVIHRSQMMRNPDGLVKMSVSFMNEPFKAYNMLRSAAVEARRNPGKASAKMLRMAIGGYLASVVTNHLITALVDTIRGDEDDEEWLEKMVNKVLGKDEEDAEPKTWQQRYLWHFMDNLVNEPLSMLPYVKDVVSLWQGYDIKRMDMQGLGDLMNAATRAGSDKYTIGMKIADVSAKAADLFGIPASSFKREVETITKLILGAVDSPWVDYQVSKLFNSIKSSKNSKAFLDILYRAYEQGDMETYKRIVKDMMENGFTASDIEGGMRSRAKKAGVSVADIGSVDFSTGIEPKYKEEANDSKFNIDSLTPQQYLEYSENSGDLKEKIINEFQRRGFGQLDEESANDLLSAAYTYAEQTALMDAADVDIVYKTEKDSNGDEIDVAYVKIDGKLYKKEDNKEWGHIADWVVKAQDADELGLTVPEWLMLREKYSGQGVSITSDGVYDAYEAGVEVENYLAFKAGTKDMESRYEKVGFIETMGLDDDEFNALLAHSVFDQKSVSENLEADQYDDYARSYSRLMDIADEAVNGIQGYDGFNEEAQEKISDYAETFAREAALISINDDYDASKWIDEALEAISSGVPLGTVFESKAVYSSLNAQDETGKTVSGLKKKRFMEWLDTLGLSRSEKNAILEVNGWKAEY